MTVAATQFLPIGNVDTVTPGAGSVMASGWALDKDVPAQTVQVHLYVDGVWRTSIPADDPRADIAAAFPGAGAYHGWATTTPIPVASGSHELCAWGINLAGGSTNPKLACKTFTVP